MRYTTEYKILINSPTLLSDEVNAHLVKGWIICGGPAVTEVNGCVAIVQAITNTYPLPAPAE